MRRESNVVQRLHLSASWCVFTLSAAVAALYASSDSPRDFAVALPILIVILGPVFFLLNDFGNQDRQKPAITRPSRHPK